MIDHWLWCLHRNELSENDIQKLNTYLLFYKYWNQEINLATKLFKVDEFATHPIERNRKKMTTDEIRTFLGENKAIREFLPWNPVHFSFDWGYDARQMHYICTFLKHVDYDIRVKGAAELDAAS
ncbi:hypothetical protein BJ508DRAFT_324823 [Ascobolus immersus RN42]|uniref:Uncharacterized protein n=1 Tax=Ascobolus immersus RN42 TaxID=1160509 RepID=A0A3N4IEW7_ASCIM|nr:hypothetical protein BJ508DRAFT_324823 [Ascobolus immersus RN42]